MGKLKKLVSGLVLSSAVLAAVAPQAVAETTIPAQPALATTTADKVVSIATSLVGKVQYEHTWDPTHLKMDCSGFTYYVFKQAGVDLGTRDDDRQVKLGSYVPKSQVQKGDLVFFWNTASVNHADVGHVGIYIGNGKFIHNANTAHDVVIADFNGSYVNTHYITARRIK